MMIELEPSFWNRTGKRNDKSAKGHETAHSLRREVGFVLIIQQIFRKFEFFPLCTVEKVQIYGIFAG